MEKGLDTRPQHGRGRLVLRVAVGIALLEAALLVSVFQPTPHSGGDNAAYVALAHALAEGRGYVELWEPGAPPHAKYPPVFPAILSAALLLGAAGWTQLKAISVLFVWLAVLLSFAWMSGRRGVAFAAAVAVLLGLSDAFLTASHWVLSEPPFVAFVLFGLWAGDRAGGGWWREEPERGGGAASPAPSPRAAVLWTAAAGLAALLASFTRGAGLPLVAAFLLWLGLRRAWGSLALALPLFAVPGALWWLRVRSVGEADYASEFWMVDPYRPEAGEAGALDLGVRMVANLVRYVGIHFPEGLTGVGGVWSWALGVPLFLLATWGWSRRVGRAPGLAELFAPLYLGLILLWPEVWSGDRFALPLYPLLLFYGGEALLRGTKLLQARTARGRGVAGPNAAIPPAVGSVALLLLLLPAMGGWAERVRLTSFCRAEVEREGPWACHLAPVREFAAAAEWSGENLPEGTVVVTRKPRIFHVLSALPSRMFPLSPDPDVLLAEMEASGASYLVLDRMDGVGLRYLHPAVAGRPEAFCHLAGWESGGEGQTDLLGLVPPEKRPEADRVRREGGSIFLEPCEEAGLVPEPLVTPYRLDRRP